MFNSTLRWGCRLALLFILFSQALIAQLRPIFDQLDATQITSRFFYPQTFRQRLVPDPLTYSDVITASESASLFSAFDRACLDSTLYIDDFSDFLHDMKAQARALESRAISILDISYHDFKQGAYDNGLVTISNGKIYHAPEATESPFVEKRTLVLWVDASIIPDEEVSFVLNENFYITNDNTLPLSIEIDFDDGEGFREIHFGLPITINFANTSVDRTFKLKVTKAGNNVQHAAMKSKGNLEFKPCLSTTFPFPDFPLWPSTSSTSPWEISAEHNGQTFYANAYTLKSDDQVFDKPFIFVEGIDFGLDGDGEPIFDTYINGNFGWCEFSSGFTDPNPNDDIEYGYDNLELMPDLLHELRAYGYDIILLDFKDGATDIRFNGELLIKLIQLCNEYKEGSESLVVAGASMGGQVSKYALRQMEMTGQDHCTRLWISMDSPHLGANIPISMQHAIYFLANMGHAGPIIFRDQYLLRPAARQMLNAQAFLNLDLRNEWYGMMDDMGYPEQCKNIVIANGNINGAGIPVNMQPHLDWECSPLSLDIVKFYLYHQSGNMSYPNEEGNTVLAHMKMPSGNFQNLGNDFLSIPYPGFVIAATIDLIDVESSVVYAPPGITNWDYAPGGMRNSIQSFAKALNSQLESVDADLLCDLIGEEDYNTNHCFVSTSSALGVDNSNPYADIGNLIEINPNSLPFDAYYAPLSGNEEHVKVTTENSEFILSYVLSYEYSALEEELTSANSNNGTFNYGEPNFREIKDIWIHDGGTLHFNANMPTHFSDNIDDWSTAGNMSFSTALCSPATIHISNNGIVNIGDQFNPSYTAEVHLYRDSKLVVNTDGLLRINAGSKLVIHEGAELTLEDGCQLEVNNGRIEVLSGGVMNVFGIGLTSNSLFSQDETVHSLKLNGHDACISFENGKLQLSDNVTLQFDTSVDETGYIEILPGSENTLLTDVGSKVIFNGKNQDDVVLRINDYAHLQNANFGLGSLEFKNCKIDLNNHGEIWTDLPVNIDHATFVANELDITHNGRIVVWHTNCVVKNSIFTQVKLGTRYTKLGVDQTQFYGAHSGVEADNGAYEILGSVFDIASVHSVALQYASLIQGCHFDGGVESQVFDKSLVELSVKGCLFSHASEFAVEKKGGKLSISCSVFADVYGVKVSEGELNMSSNDGAGYNEFNQTQQCIFLDNASSVDLVKGYNDFSGFQYHYIKGTINLPCGEGNCFPEINSAGNCWGYTQSPGNLGIPDQLVQPDPQYFDVSTTIVEPCAGYENTNACSIIFYDQSPVFQENCPDKVKLEVKVKMASGGNSGMDGSGQAANSAGLSANPILSTVSFQGISLDSALVYAATKSEAYDSLGNDELAIDLLHEILTSGLDFYNMAVRSKMNWARYVMKSCVERLFLKGELSELNNQSVFELPVQRYVDVLNLMTDTALTDSTYRDQFYLELDKGQLFRTIGNRETALTIFDHLGDCQMDSLEQTILYKWSMKTQHELDVIHQYIVQQVRVDSEFPSGDSVSSSNTFNVVQSDFYFGLWIDSPQSITFVACGRNPVYRGLYEEEKMFGLFPNPSEDLVHLVGFEKDIKVEVQLWDMQGRRVSNIKFSQDDNAVYWPNSISSGTYILRILTEDGTEDHLVVIAK